MQHAIKANEHGPLGDAMANAVQTCVHCGFCLAACPTYRELGQEMDSPRGRIVLMKEVLEGTIAAEVAQPHIDRCLGCLACEPACPSGVPYRDLISPYRAKTEPQARRGFMWKLRRRLAAMTIPYPGRFRLALVGAKVGRAFRWLVPPALRPMLALAPRSVPPAVTLPRIVPAKGHCRARVALLTGCAQQVLDPDINVATIDVLTRNGIEVVIPPDQGCCGGLAWHTGDFARAQAMARHNLDAFPTDINAIITNAAGCGSTLHEYHLILRGTPDEARADKFRHKVVDVGSFLADLGLREKPTGWPGRRPIAYHDACHLANAQNVRAEPRKLLRSIPGVEVREVADAHLCCGSAGTYNLDQPEMARALGLQKAHAVLTTGAKVVATGNIGCLTQLRTHLQQLDSTVTVRHTIQVLRDAYYTTPPAPPSLP
jgi:glycolate oxidase iron-sulfur subunit